MNTKRRASGLTDAEPSATIRAARVVAPGQVEVVAAPAPEAAAGQVQLRDRSTVFS